MIDSKWISVSSQFPDGDCNWDEYIVCNDGCVQVGRWYPVPQKWYSEFPCKPENDITDQVTHWMPFPEPPKD